MRSEEDRLRERQTNRRRRRRQEGVRRRSAAAGVCRKRRQGGGGECGAHLVDGACPRCQPVERGICAICLSRPVAGRRGFARYCASDDCRRIARRAYRHGLLGVIA